MVLDPIPQSLPVHFFGSRPQPPTSLYICLEGSPSAGRHWLSRVMCVYMYTYIYIHMYTHIYIHPCILIYTHTYILSCLEGSPQVQADLHESHVYIYIYIQVYKHIYTYKYIYIYMYIYVYLHMCI